LLPFLLAEPRGKTGACDYVLRLNRVHSITPVQHGSELLSLRPCLKAPILLLRPDARRLFQNPRNNGAMFRHNRCECEALAGICSSQFAATRGVYGNEMRQVLEQTGAIFHTHLLIAVATDAFI
jgi:hypothetical protein